MSDAALGCAGMTSPRFQLALLVALLLGTAFGQYSCLGAGQPQNVALAATVVEGFVESVQYITPQRLVLQTDDPNNNIYLSNDGGLTWFEPLLNDQAGALSSVVSCFANSPTCYILRGNGNLWRSDDSGATFSLVSQGSALSLFSLAVSPFVRTTLLGLARAPACFVLSQLSSCNGMLMHSTDGGVTWTQLLTYVYEVSWSSADPQRIFLLHWPDQTGNAFTKSLLDLRFALSDSLFVGYQDVFQNAVDFLLIPANTEAGWMEEILWVGVVQGAQTLVLYSSTNSGDTFLDNQFPSTRQIPQGYELLATSLDTAFVHVTYSNSFTQGSLFYSDLSGGLFYTSLLNQTASIALGTPWVDVPTVPGTFFTSQTEVESSAKTERETTLVTFDNGATWQTLEPPSTACEQQAVCTLQLYFSTDVAAGAVSSVPGAVGIVMGSGTEGVSSASESNFYGSWDGGRKWTTLLEGNHAFVIGDSGGVVLAVDLRPVETQQLVFSLDWGVDWTACDFYNQPLRLASMSTIGSSSEPTFLLYGNLNTTASLVLRVDATALYSRQCAGVDAAGTAASDFELWNPNITHCVLGGNITYVRRKQSAQCRYSPSLTNFTYSAVACPCTAEDFACSTCFNAVATQCVLDPTCVPSPIVIPSPCVGSYESPSGYRKQFGNMCSGGVEASLLQPIVHSCPLTVGGIVAISVCLTLAVVGAAVATFLLVRKRCRRSAALVPPPVAAPTTEPPSANVSPQADGMPDDFDL